MSEMVERVARAMVANDSGPEGSTLFDIHWREFGDGYLSSARAAIEAMREPTDEMLMASGLLGGKTNAGKYRAMIDAALPKEVKTDG